MKRLLPLIFLLLAPVVAKAQTENHTIPVSTVNQAKETLVIRRSNRLLCTRWSLSFPCTQAAVCTAAGVVGGASCTAANARAAEARIYDSTTLAGREEFTTFGIAQPAFNDLVAAAVSEQIVEGCSIWATMNTTQRNNVCSSYTPALPPGCNPGGCP